MIVTHFGMGDRRVTATTYFLFGLCPIALPATAIEISDVRLVSVASDGTPANESSDGAAVSGDGRFVVFASEADNLVPDDTNAAKDVFVHDTVSGETRRVSLATDGSEANGASTAPAISSDGNYVLFSSAATNLVAGDGNGLDDIFLRDLASAETTRVNVANDGTESLGPVSRRVSISDDGRFVVFSSAAPDLVIDDTNGVEDAFVHDRDSSETRRISITTGGDQVSANIFAPIISGNGRFVAFESEAAELAPDDINGRSDVFLVDLVTGAIERLSNAPDGTQQNGQGNPDFVATSVSLDADWIAFSSDATNLVPNDSNTSDVFLLRRSTDQIIRISENASGVGANSHAGAPVVSSDGRFVLYRSEASNIVPPTHPGDAVISQAFLHDTDSGQTIRVSGDTGAGQANPFGLDISDDGLAVVLGSATRNLLASAPVNQQNVFLIRISDSTSPDTTPDAFSFINQTGVASGSVITSDAITISGIEAPAQISVTNGEYSIGCSGTFTASNGTISDGETVCIRHTSSALSGTAQVTTLTVGGVSGTFTSTTAAAPPPPPPPNQGGGGGGAMGFMTLLTLLLLRRRRNLPRA
jgi:Tol biopolymer transport system component